jgi:hypothetical protein
MNIYILFWLTVIAQIFSVALLVCATFIGVGLIAVDKAATKQLLAHSVKVLLSFHALGQDFVLTRPLVLLSAIFGCVASLTLATVNLQEPDKLNAFLDSTLIHHRRSLAALTCYLTAIADLHNDIDIDGILAELKPDQRDSLFTAIQNALVRSDPRLIATVIRLARTLNLTELVAQYGLDLLLALPDDKLRALPVEVIDYVLTTTATAAGLPRDEEIKLIRDKCEPAITNWRRQWKRAKPRTQLPQTQWLSFLLGIETNSTTTALD